MRQFSLDDIMDLDPCWPRDSVGAMMAHHGKDTVTTLDILNCDDVGDLDAISIAEKMLGQGGRVWRAMISEFDLCDREGQDRVAASYREMLRGWAR